MLKNMLENMVRTWNQFLLKIVYIAIMLKF